MKTKVYAVAEKVPAYVDYLTAGKLYEVSDADDNRFNLQTDEGGLNFCLWTKCAHLNGGNWTRLELPDVDPRDVAELIEAARGALGRVTDLKCPESDRLTAILNKIEGKK